MKIQFKNLAIRSGFFIMTVISLAACGNADKKNENTVNGNITT
jgi:predicted small lipoprotein YifL